MIKLLPLRLSDEQLERVRRNHHDAIEELQAGVLASAAIIHDVELADGIATAVPHGRGRAVVAIVSVPRGAVTSGRIDEIRDNNAADRTQYVTLTATGWGATITVDLVVL